VDEIHAMFKGAVNIGRGGVADEYMQGQDFMGEKSVSIGMADQLGTLDDAVELVRVIKEKM